MDSATNDAWNAWFDARIAPLLAEVEQKRAILRDAVKAAMTEQFQKERRYTDRAIRQLRRELTTKQHNADIVDLPNPLVRKRA